MTGQPASGPARRPRPTAAELEAADGGTIPDLVRPGLRLLLVGINPGRWSGASGFHFGNPSNRLWPVLHLAGFTPRRLHPTEGPDLLEHGIGITNLVGRTTRTAADLSPAELREGVERLRATVAAARPAVVAILGKSAWEIAFGGKAVPLGRQPEPFEGAVLWLLPNTSGLNASYQLPDLVARFAEVRALLEGGSS